MTTEALRALERTLKLLHDLGHDGDLDNCSVCRDVETLKALAASPPPVEALREAFAEGAWWDMQRSQSSYAKSVMPQEAKAEAERRYPRQPVDPKDWVLCRHDIRRVDCPECRQPAPEPLSQRAGPSISRNAGSPHPPAREGGVK